MCRISGATWKPEIRAIGTLAAVQGVDLCLAARRCREVHQLHSHDQVKDASFWCRSDDAVETRRPDVGARGHRTAISSAMEPCNQPAQTGVNSDAALEEASSALASSQSTLAKIQAVLDQKAIEAPFAGTMGIPRIDVDSTCSPAR